MLEKTRREIDSLESEYVLKASTAELEQYFLAQAAVEHDLLVASDFQCGGALSPATQLTLGWWSRTKRWVSTVAVRLQSAGRRPTNVWAFPSAFLSLKRGTKYSASNWNLDATIQAAVARLDLS